MFVNRQITNISNTIKIKKMKKIMLLVTACLISMIGMASCGEKSAKSEVAQQAKTTKVVKKKAHADGVELILFHGKQRCVTCRAIETEALAMLDANFAKQVKEGKVTFRLVDFSTPEGEKEADTYKVASSSLYINKWKNGQKTSEDLTQFAFANARMNKAKYHADLKAKINTLLK